MFKIIRSENKITIKKFADRFHIVFLAIIFGCGVLVPIVFANLRSLALFWALYAICMLGNVGWFASASFGKIVLDSEKREIHIYDWFRETYRFDEIRGLRLFFQEGDSEGGSDINKVLFLLANRCNSRVEMKELREGLIQNF